MAVSSPAARKMHPVWWILIIGIAVGIVAPMIAAAAYWLKGKVTGTKA
jgi:uncharacterized membrane protein (DUF106 family)